MNCNSESAERRVQIAPSGVGVGVVAIGIASWLGIGTGAWTRGAVAVPSAALTYNKDIAPILFKECARCHRPGQSAPFSLLTFEEARKRSKEIVEVTQRRYMPPWMPEPGHGEFVDERRLTAEQIDLIQRWEANGAVEGAAADSPPQPEFPGGWPLGPPNLEVKLAEPFRLPPEGPDVYRNFVISMPMAQRAYLRGIDFHPGTRAVHHAFIRFDPTDGSRQADAAEPGPGFGGLHMPPSVENPASQFLTWQPGKRPSLVSDDLASPIEAGSDLVLQLHLRPTGREEVVQPQLALYFGDKPPTAIAAKILLGSLEIDIPAGSRDHRVSDAFTLPVDVEVRAILPHAHYLAKEVRARAVLPDQREERLLWIKDWDFNWQGDYRYAKPVLLPMGTRLELEFHYDNSADNPRNPNHPPARVRYGTESTDEMAELWLQVVLRSRADADALMGSTRSRFYRNKILFNEYVLRKNPADARSHNELGRAFLMTQRRAEAIREFQEAVRLKPDYDTPHYYLGIAYRQAKNLAEAGRAFEEALRINPSNHRAHGNLGLVLMEQGHLDLAEAQFRSALRLNPEDEISRDSLADLLRAKTQSKGRQ